MPSIDGDGPMASSAPISEYQFMSAFIPITALHGDKCDIEFIKRRYISSKNEANI